MRLVDHAAGDQLRIRDDQARAVEGLDLGRAHADAADVALLIAGNDPVADFDRPLDQQDEARDEIVDDRLEAEADAERERAGDDRQIGDVEAGIGERDHGGKRDTAVADGGFDRVGDAGFDAPRLQDTLAHPALDDAGQEQQRDEEEDADQDARRRHLELADLEAEERRREPVADFGRRETPLDEDDRDDDDEQQERQQQFGEPREFTDARLLEAQAAR